MQVSCTKNLYKYLARLSSALELCAFTNICVLYYSKFEYEYVRKYSSKKVE